MQFRIVGFYLECHRNAFSMGRHGYCYCTEQGAGSTGSTRVAAVYCAQWRLRWPDYYVSTKHPIVAPVYNVQVHSDGRVRFTGYENTKTIGRIEHQLAADQLDRLRSKIAGYFAKRETRPRPPHFAGNACNKLDLLSRVYSSLGKFTQVIESENSAQMYIAFREAVESELMTLQYRCPIPNSVKTINGKKTNICRAVVEADGLIWR